VRRVVFLTPAAARHGFALAGMGERTVAEGETRQALQEVMAEPDVGVVVADERLLREVSEESLREMEGRWGGILLALPTPEKGAAEELDYAQRLIRRALGYHVRLKL